jgi:serine/threonine-protein kinase
MDDSRNEAHSSGVRAPLVSAGLVVVQQYRLRRKIANGGMGCIWEADDLDLGRIVAVKFLADSLCEDEVSLKRFDREARSAARLRTPYAAQVYAHGTIERVPYIVMERLYGEDLHARLERVGRMPLNAIAKVATEACKALREAHSIGIIHRDLKPANLFLSTHDGEETTKLVDFGVARDELSLESITRTGVRVGSPSYMSPEQVSGDRVLDGRTDLWSLGVIIYRALTGKKPFSGDTPVVMRKIAEERARAPSTICPGLPPSADVFMKRALATDRNKRFRDANEFLEAFQAVVWSARQEWPAVQPRVPTPIPIPDDADPQKRTTWRPPSR